MRKFRNSDLIMPISIIIHLGVINGILFLLSAQNYLNTSHVLYYNALWLVIAYILDYYPLGRKEKFITNLRKVSQLYFLYGLAYFALFGIVGKMYDFVEYQLLIYVLICVALTWYRVLFFWARSQYQVDHCQARMPEKLHFHWNASLRVVNPARAVHCADVAKKERGGFSMADIKTQCHNRLLLDRFLREFGISPHWPKNKAKVRKLSYGARVA